MHRKMSSSYAMIKATVNRHLVPEIFKRLEQGGGLIFLTYRLWEETLLLESQQISDRNKALGSDSRATGRLQRYSIPSV